MNIFVGIGRMTAQPELSFSKNGVAICTFTLAIDRQFDREKTDFIRVKCFKKVAENTANYCDKGSLVAVNGSVQVDTYEKDGQRRSFTNIIANQVKFLDTKNSQKPNGKDISKKLYYGDPFVGDGGKIDVDDIDDSQLPF